MLENELLGDFFECLGVLSLATGRYDMVWQDGIGVGRGNSSISM